MAKKRLTPMRRVLRVYPYAYAKQVTENEWLVYRGQTGTFPLASGYTAKQAWSRAADTL